MAIFSWAGEGGRNVTLRTDNQNVLRWIEHARPQYPVAGRILRALNVYCVQNGFGVFPVYVRSAHNLFADGLTRWSDSELAVRVALEGMTQVDGAARLWAGMGLSYNPASECEPLPNTFALMGRILHFIRAYN